MFTWQMLMYTLVNVMYSCTCYQMLLNTLLNVIVHINVQLYMLVTVKVHTTKCHKTYKIIESQNENTFLTVAL